MGVSLRIALVVLAVASAASLSACGKRGDPKPPAPAVEDPAEE
ncbi:MAG: lipoprotein [Pseudomonadota bacterium]